MAIEMGIIKTLIGTAFATAIDGSQRSLQAGDRIYQDEVITTGPSGAVEVEFTDGSIMTLGRSSQTVLSEEVFNPQAVAPTDVASDVEALQQALLEGADPSQVSAVTAAGAGAAGAGNEGVDIVQVIHEAPEVTPENGFDTAGINVVFDESEEEDELPIEEVTPEEPNSVPETSTTSISVDEDDLVGEDSEYSFPVSSEDRGAFQSATGLFLYDAYDEGNHDNAPGDDNAGADAPTLVVGTLNASFGSDGAGDINWNETGQPSLTSGGETVNYWVSEDGHTLIAYVGESSELLQGKSSNGGDAELIFVAEITDPLTGDYSFILVGSLDHPDKTTEDNLLVDLTYTISDSDGDTAQGALTVDVDDDSPVVKSGEPTEFIYELTITNHDDVSSAGYHSSYGYYVKGEGGIPTTGLVIWDDVHDTDVSQTVLVVGHSPEQIGFFIIPNGDNLNPTLIDNTAIEFIQLPSGEWQAVIPGTPGTPLIGAGSNVLFDDDGLNPIDNRDHVQDNDLIGNQNWEDLPILTGDGDYIDENVNVEWTLISETGGEPEIDFGADGGPLFSGEILVSDDDGAITSGGEDIVFTLEDINDDGKLDLVGSTGDSSSDLVLTVDDILSDDEPVVELFGAGIDTPSGNVTVNIGGAFTDGDGDPAVQFNVNVEILLAQQDQGDAA